MKAKFKKLLLEKTNKMYDDNLISRSDIDDLEVFLEIFYFAYLHQPTKYERFKSFEKNDIGEFNKIASSHKKKYYENEYAQEVCKYFYDLKK